MGDWERIESVSAATGRKQIVVGFLSLSSLDFVA
jgi:hypothetical protein